MPETEGNDSIAAVIVTYNRLLLLKESIRAIRQQTVSIDSLIVVNNGSSDGTTEWLNNEPNLHAIHKNNDGSAGAYYAGIKHAYEKGFGYIWLMDDDGIADEKALEELLNAKKNLPVFSFLCSKVISAENIFMNAPAIDTNLSRYDYPMWGQYSEHCITGVKNAAYISLFINSACIKASGMPCRDFFFWADDIDFTTRLYKQAPGYMAGRSIVKHLRENPSVVSILTEMNVARIKLHYYNIRNGLYLSRRDNKLPQYCIDLLVHTRNMFRCLSRKHGFMRFGIYLRGFFASFFFRPAIEFPDA